MSIDTVCQAPESILLLPSFNIINETYKSIGNQPIGVHILVPKDIPPGKRPLLVRIHGGGFTEGSSDSWLRPWILDLALKHKAVLVTPDYRLRPESEIVDIIDDLRDFWRWVDTTLAQLPGFNVDVTNTAVVGESAGGYLTAQTSLLGMTKYARVLMVQYPLIDFEAQLRWLEAVPQEQKVPVSVLDEYLAGLAPGQILTRAPNGTRGELMLSMLHNGRFVNIDQHPHLDPMKSLDSAGPLPPVMLFHGIDDTDVRVEDSQAWVDKLRRLQPDVPLHFVTREGSHCFDQADTLETPWLKEPIEFVEKYWPAS